MGGQGEGQEGGRERGPAPTKNKTGIKGNERSNGETSDKNIDWEV